jgi:hypothetical protein
MRENKKLCWESLVLSSITLQRAGACIIMWPCMIVNGGGGQKWGKIKSSVEKFWSYQALLSSERWCVYNHARPVNFVLHLSSMWQTKTLTICHVPRES